MTLIRVSAVFLLACGLGGCRAIQSRMMSSAMIDGIYGIDAYQGRIMERGLLRNRPAAVVLKDIQYERLWKVRAEVVAPKEHRGQLFIFDGASYKIWWPRFFFGLSITGVPLPRREAVEETIRESCDWAVENYAFEYQGDRELAGRDAVLWEGSPRSDSLAPWYRAWMDKENSLPLKIEVRREGREWYEMTALTVDTVSHVERGTFDFEFPEGAIVYHWDLARPGVSAKRAQEKTDFPLMRVTKLPPGHTVNKIVTARTPNGEDMVALMMQKGASWISLTQMPDMGPILMPEMGVAARLGGEEAVINFAFGWTIVSWAKQGVALTMISNLPYPQVVAMAESVEPWSFP